MIIDTLTIDETLFQEHKTKGLLLDKKGTVNPCIQTLKVKPEGKSATSRASFCNGYIA